MCIRDSTNTVSTLLEDYSQLDTISRSLYNISRHTAETLAGVTATSFERFSALHHHSGGSSGSSSSSSLVDELLSSSTASKNSSTSTTTAGLHPTSRGLLLQDHSSSTAPVALSVLSSVERAWLLTTLSGVRTWALDGMQRLQRHWPKTSSSTASGMRIGGRDPNEDDVMHVPLSNRVLRVIESSHDEVIKTFKDASLVAQMLPAVSRVSPHSSQPDASFHRQVSDILETLDRKITPNHQLFSKVHRATTSQMYSPRHASQEAIKAVIPPTTTTNNTSPSSSTTNTATPPGPLRLTTTMEFRERTLQTAEQLLSVMATYIADSVILTTTTTSSTAIEKNESTNGIEDDCDDQDTITNESTISSTVLAPPSSRHQQHVAQFVQSELIPEVMWMAVSCYLTAKNSTPPSTTSVSSSSSAAVDKRIKLVCALSAELLEGSSMIIYSASSPPSSSQHLALRNVMMGLAGRDQASPTTTTTAATSPTTANDEDGDIVATDNNGGNDDEVSSLIQTPLRLLQTTYGQQTKDDSDAVVVSTLSSVWRTILEVIHTNPLSSVGGDNNNKDSVATAGLLRILPAFALSGLDSTTSSSTRTSTTTTTSSSDASLWSRPLPSDRDFECSSPLLLWALSPHNPTTTTTTATQTTHISVSPFQALVQVFSLISEGCSNTTTSTAAPAYPLACLILDPADTLSLIVGGSEGEGTEVSLSRGHVTSSDITTASSTSSPDNNSKDTTVVEMMKALRQFSRPISSSSGGGNTNNGTIEVSTKLWQDALRLVGKSTISTVASSDGEKNNSSSTLANLVRIAMSTSSSTTHDHDDHARSSGGGGSVVISKSAWPTSILVAAALLASQQHQQSVGGSSHPISSVLNDALNRAAPDGTTTTITTSRQLARQYTQVQSAVHVQLVVQRLLPVTYLMEHVLPGLTDSTFLAQGLSTPAHPQHSHPTTKTSHPSATNIPPTLMLEASGGDDGVDVEGNDGDSDEMDIGDGAATPHLQHDDDATLDLLDMDEGLEDGDDVVGGVPASTASSDWGGNHNSNNNDNADDIQNTTTTTASASSGFTSSRTSRHYEGSMVNSTSTTTNNGAGRSNSKNRGSSSVVSKTKLMLLQGAIETCVTTMLTSSVPLHQAVGPTTLYHLLRHRSIDPPTTTTTALLPPSLSNIDGFDGSSENVEEEGSRDVDNMARLHDMRTYNDGTNEDVRFNVQSYSTGRLRKRFLEYLFNETLPTVQKSYQVVNPIQKSGTSSLSLLPSSSSENDIRNNDDDVKMMTSSSLSTVARMSFLDLVRRQVVFLEAYQQFSKDNAINEPRQLRLLATHSKVIYANSLNNPERSLCAVLLPSTSSAARTRLLDPTTAPFSLGSVALMIRDLARSNRAVAIAILGDQQQHQDLHELLQGFDDPQLRLTDLLSSSGGGGGGTSAKLQTLAHAAKELVGRLNQWEGRMHPYPIIPLRGTTQSNFTIIGGGGGQSTSSSSWTPATSIGDLFNRSHALGVHEALGVRHHILCLPFSKKDYESLKTFDVSRGRGGLATTHSTSPFANPIGAFIGAEDVEDVYQQLSSTSSSGSGKGGSSVPYCDPEDDPYLVGSAGVAPASRARGRSMRPSSLFKAITSPFALYPTSNNNSSSSSSDASTTRKNWALEMYCRWRAQRHSGSGGLVSSGTVSEEWLLSDLSLIHI
eukprot:TRINITY_DN20033_c0_g1_i2.p1 TRINITY_DN20033_c0_g1~~TRINITY_DN20033_c0_g1_i2.p1  ORF type:complete len:1671 (+),score=229.46 TRINITY_DN20033_c0_g1_i2:153-5165(+)